MSPIQRRIALWGTLGVLLVGGLVCAFQPQPVPVDLSQVQRGPLRADGGSRGIRAGGRR